MEIIQVRSFQFFRTIITEYESFSLSYHFCQFLWPWLNFKTKLKSIFSWQVLIQSSSNCVCVCVCVCGPIVDWCFWFTRLGLSYTWYGMAHYKCPLLLLLLYIKNCGHIHDHTVSNYITLAERGTGFISCLWRFLQMLLDLWNYMVILSGYTSFAELDPFSVSQESGKKPIMKVAYFLVLNVSIEHFALLSLFRVIFG